MPFGTVRLVNVPDDRVDLVRAEAVLDRPMAVTAGRQNDGRWMIEAVFSPYPEGFHPVEIRDYAASAFTRPIADHWVEETTSRAVHSA